MACFVATRLSDGVMNIALLQFETEEDAGDERGKDFIGLHHFGILVDDMPHAIAKHDPNRRCLPRT